MKEIFKKIIVFIITLEARLVVKKYKPKIVAITGSVGKTSVKEAVAVVLSIKYKTRKSARSYNSEIGVPLAILNCENGWYNPFAWLYNILRGVGLLILKKEYPEWLVLEFGVERPGDMEKLISWLNPHIAVVTALSDIPAHVEFFASPQNLAKEKTKLLKNLGIDDFAILNFDDATVYEMKEKTKAKIITYGFGSTADFTVSSYHLIEKGLMFNADSENSSVPVRLFNVFGKHHVYTALAALAVGKAAEVNIVEAATALLNYESPPGRLKLLEGVKNTFILDDTYNSSPMALRVALEALRDNPAQRKIVVLGDMLELGKYTIEAHKSMADFILDSGAAIVFTIGPRARFIAESLREKNFPAQNIFEFSTSDEAKKPIEENIKEGDLILVKGSQAMRMERIVEEIMAHPEDKEKLLVRQEKEWLNKK